MSQLWGPKYSTDIKLGDLLVQAELLSVEDQAAVLKLAENKRLHIGQLLVMGGYLNSQQLQAALDAQSAIRDKVLEFNVAVNCLKIACASNKTFADATKENSRKGITISRTVQTCRLGELLVSAGALSCEQVEAALGKSLAAGLPLGRVLVIQKFLNDEELNSVLEIQVRLRDELINRDEALNEIRFVFGMTANLGSSGAFADVRPPDRYKPPYRIKLGELLVLSGILRDIDVMCSVELGLERGIPLGQLLVEQNFISESTLEAALELQQQVEAGILEGPDAARSLASVHFDGMTLDQALWGREAQAPVTELSFSRFLTISKVVTMEDISNAFDLCSKSPEILAKVLLITGFTDEQSMSVCVHLYEQLLQGRISEEAALAAISYCKQKGFTNLEDLDGEIESIGRKMVEHATRMRRDQSDKSNSDSDDLDDTDEFPQIPVEMHTKSPVEVQPDAVAQSQPAETGGQTAATDTWSDIEPVRSTSGCAHEAEEVAQPGAPVPSPVMQSTQFYQDADQPPSREWLEDSLGKLKAIKASSPPPASSKSGESCTGASITSSLYSKTTDEELDKILNQKTDVQSPVAPTQVSPQLSTEPFPAVPQRASNPDLATMVEPAPGGEPEYSADHHLAAQPASQEKCAADLDERERFENQAEKPSRESLEDSLNKLKALKPNAPKPGRTESKDAIDVNQALPQQEESAGEEEGQSQKSAPSREWLENSLNNLKAIKPSAPRPGRSASSPQAGQRHEEATQSAPHGLAASQHETAQKAPPASEREAAPEPAPDTQQSEATPPTEPAQPAKSTVSREWLENSLNNLKAIKPVGRQPASPLKSISQASGQQGEQSQHLQSTQAPRAEIEMSQAAPSTQQMPQQSSQHAAQPAKQTEDSADQAAIVEGYRQLAENYSLHGDYEKAQGLLEQLLSIQSNKGRDDPRQVQTLEDIVTVLKMRNRLDEAESYAQRMIEISRELSPLTYADSLNCLARVYFQAEKFDQCEPLLLQEMDLRRQYAELEDSGMADNLRDYARVLKKTNRMKEAEKMYKEARKILAGSKTPREGGEEGDSDSKSKETLA